MPENEDIVVKLSGLGLSEQGKRKLEEKFVAALREQLIEEASDKVEDVLAVGPGVIGIRPL